MGEYDEFQTPAWTGDIKKTPSRRVEVESAWLVEKGEVSAPDYLCIHSGQLTWTKSHMQATRFGRKIDAGKAITGVADIEGVARICEHSWASVPDGTAALEEKEPHPEPVESRGQNELLPCPLATSPRPWKVHRTGDKLSLTDACGKFIFRKVVSSLPSIEAYNRLLADFESIAEAVNAYWTNKRAAISVSDGLKMCLWLRVPPNSPALSRPDELLFG